MYTTVILAQPRGPRLRADAVYVDRRASRGRTLDRCKPVGEKKSGGPFFRSEIKKSLRLFTKTTIKKRSVKEP